MDILAMAIERGYPVLDSIADGIHSRVWCDTCFRWHFHGRGDGLRVPHCNFSPTYYYLRESRLDPDRVYACKWGTWWKSVCPRPKCNGHRTRTTGTQSRPHHMIVQARPGPGSPVQCVVTGRFVDLKTGDVIDPGYSESQMTRFGYLTP